MDARRRWIILAVGTLAQAATCSFLYGMPMLVPSLQSHDGVGLLGASMLVSAPIAGLLLMLIPWGAAADRYGERVVIVSGVSGAAVLLGLAAAVRGTVLLAVLLALAGAAAASVNAASGRVVMGWFEVRQRGLAMGIRQMAQPLGVAVAGLVLPPLAHASGPHGALIFPAGFCAVMAVFVAVLLADPPRATPATDAAPPASPYRGSRILPRIHLASTLLVVPQFAVASFTVVYLVNERGWDPTTAGRIVFGFQIAGALGRIASGVWSDAVGSRLRPMRQLAVGSAFVMLLLGFGAWQHSWIVVLAFGLGAVITVADNGLAYTAVAEAAGVAWSGRALGVHNTTQNIAAVATAPLLAAIIGADRYAVAFVSVALWPLAAIALTPVRAERTHAGRGRRARSTART